MASVPTSVPFSHHLLLPSPSLHNQNSSPLTFSGFCPLCGKPPNPSRRRRGFRRTPDREMSVKVPMPASTSSSWQEREEEMLLESRGFQQRDIESEMTTILPSRNSGATSRNQLVSGRGEPQVRSPDVETSYGNKIVPAQSKSLLKRVKCFDVELTPDTIAVAMVYFVQGVLGLSRLAVSFYLKDDLHLDPAEVVDSMVVERARGESQSTSGSLQSLCWGSSAFGGIASAYFSGSLVDTYGVRFVFGATAFLPLITSAVAALVNEQQIARGHNLSLTVPGFIETSKQNIIQLWDSVKQPNIFLPTLFIFLWQATPQSDSAMFFFTTNKLGFTPEFLGRVKLITSVASLLGVGLYNGFLKNVPLRKIFLVTTIIGAALGMTQVFLVTGLNRQFGVSDEWFAIGDSLIITVLGQVASEV